MKQKGPREKYLEVLGQPAMCKHYSQPRKKIDLDASPTKLPNMLLPINTISTSRYAAAVFCLQGFSPPQKPASQPCNSTRCSPTTCT